MSTTGDSNPISLKLKNFYESGIENDDEIMRCLQHLNNFFPSNVYENRKNFDTFVDHYDIEIAKQFIKSFGELKTKFVTLESQVMNIAMFCEEMKEKLENVRQDTFKLLQKTADFQHQANNIDMKCNLAEALLRTFQLPQIESEVLLSVQADCDLDMKFFSILEKAKTIANHSKILLNLESENAGLEILDETSRLLEVAHKNLYKWIQSECRSCSRTPLELKPQLCEAMHVMQGHFTLFNCLLQEYIAARRSTFSYMFVRSLTSTADISVCSAKATSLSDSLSSYSMPDDSAGGRAKPIDIMSHEPLRYFGDILAWLHQELASEKELLMILLKSCDDTDELKAAREKALDSIIEGSCRTVKERLEQLIINETDSIQLFKYENLFQFYENTFRKLLPIDAALCQTIKDIKNLTWNLFLGHLRSFCQEIALQTNYADVNLMPSREVQGSIQLLQNIFISQDVSTSHQENRQLKFKEILKIVVDASYQHCTASAKRLLDPTDAAIYMVNSLYFIQCQLSKLEFTDEKLTEIQGYFEKQMDTLAQAHTVRVLNKTNLLSIYESVNRLHLSELSLDGPLSQLQRPGLGEDEVRDALKAFDRYLEKVIDVGSEDTTKLRKLSNDRLRSQCQRRSADSIGKAYSCVFEAVQLPYNHYSDQLRASMKTPEQIAALLLL